MTDEHKKLQPKQSPTQCTGAEVEERSALHDAEHQEEHYVRFSETCKKLEEAHREWESALDVVQDLVFMHDKDFKILRCNRAYQRCAGIPFKQIIGKPYYDIYPKTNAPQLPCLHAENSAEPVAAEELEVGDLIYNSRSFPIYDENGAYRYSVHILEDITESKRMNDRLRLFRNLIDHSADGIYFVDPATSQIMDVNDAACRDMGYSREELLQRSVLDIQTGISDITAWQAHMQELKASGVPLYEFDALRKDGSQFPVEVTSRDFTLGDQTYVIAVVRDITIRKAADRALRDSESRLKLIMESVQTGIIIIDPADHKIVDVNAAAATMIGAPKEEIIGSVCHRFICPAEVGECPITDLGQTVDHSERLLLTSSGGECQIIKSVARVQFEGKEHLLESCMDITDRKKAECEMLRLNRVLKTLSECNHAMLRASHETELMQSMCRVITSSGGYSLAWIGLARQDENKSIEAVAIAGEGKDYVESLQLTWDDQPAGQGPSGTAIRTSRTQVVHDIRNDPRFALWREAAVHYGYAARIALPLKNKGSAFGTLNIYSGEVSAFGDEEVALLEEVADDLAFGIVHFQTSLERDQAVQGRQHYIERLRESLEEALQAIAITIEMRDPYTAGHQRRVADLASSIARELGLTEDQVHGIHLAGIVHDIGKIRIPAEVLSKPGLLDKIEFSFIETHSQVGYEILKKVQFPWPIAQAVLQHHERLDGSGYPQSLKGDAIILESRILAVADVVEAMSSHRPYRPSLGLEAALKEIDVKRGIQFDPRVVDACLALFHERNYSFKE